MSAEVVRGFLFAESAEVLSLEASCTDAGTFAFSKVMVIYNYIIYSELCRLAAFEYSNLY
jgi:hypothetical protein